MTELVAVAGPETINPPPMSTTLDTSPVGATQNGGGEVKQPAKPESVQDSIRSVIKAADAKEKAETAPKDGEKVEAKVADASKDVKPADDKSAKVDDVAKTDATAKADKSAAEKPAAERAVPEDGRQSEGRKHSEPPARFLPEARTKWANVPNEVKAEFHRVSQEFETELSDHKQFREGLKDYEALAKQHNVTIKDTLDRYTNADKILQEDFGRGISELIKLYGHNPVQAMASILRAQGITPQQYAQHVAQNPQAHQVAAPVQQQQQPHHATPDPQVAALAEEVRQLKQNAATAPLLPVIEKFASSHPDYGALEEHIASVLKSGVIDQLYGTGLSPEQKLAEAYRMAGGRGPTPNPDPTALAPDTSQRPTAVRPVDPDGRKSVTGALNGGDSPDDDDAETDIRAMLKKGLRKAV